MAVDWNKDNEVYVYYVDRLDDPRDGPGQELVALEEQLIYLDQPEHKCCDLVQLDVRMVEEADKKIGDSQAAYRIAATNMTTDSTVGELEVLEVIQAWGVEAHWGYVYDLARLKREVRDDENVTMISEGTFRSG